MKRINEVYLNDYKKYELDDFKYVVFILAYDLLQDYLMKEEDKACDIAFKKICNIAEDFLKSDYNDTKYSLYECLEKYVKEVVLSEDNT